MDLIISTSFGLFFGAVTTALIKFYLNHPLVEALVNTTLVFLKNTEMVWKPVAETVLAILKPLGPIALVAVKSFIYALILVTEMVGSLVSFIRTTGTNITLAIKHIGSAMKDVVVSVGTILRAAGYIFSRVVNSISYVVTSFEHVGNFLYRMVFEYTTITWNDIVNISLPFVVVSSVLAFLFWKPQQIEQKEVPCLPQVPRRSSRLARKQAEAAFSASPCAT